MRPGRLATALTVNGKTQFCTDYLHRLFAQEISFLTDVPEGTTESTLICDCWQHVNIVTSCAGGRHNMPPPPASWPLTSDLESGVRVTCDVAYLCANFSLPRHLCSRLWPDVRDRQTDRRQRDVGRQTRIIA